MISPICISLTVLEPRIDSLDRGRSEHCADFCGDTGPTCASTPQRRSRPAIQMIAASIGVGPYPVTLASERLIARQIEKFDPGWLPKPLSFTAFYLSEPRNALAERCAALALEIAESN